ncbi:MAG: FG-GAP repeat protein, partial [Saprospiraceae bacterium]
LFSPVLNILIISQNVGVGTITPTEKLDVEGNLKADTIKPNAVLFAPNAGVGKILTSDGIGNATWENMMLPPPQNNTGNVGYGVWGDCATNGNITDYHPVADTAGVAGDFFGNSVSISGDFAIVGSLTDDETYINQGSVTIYKFNNGHWEWMQKITDPDGSANDKFGTSVSISGYYAIVGADFDDGPGGNDQGSASIFGFNGTNWVLVGKIIDPLGDGDDHFGFSVSISGNYAIVGAMRDNGPGGNDQGSASIFEFNGTNWVLMQTITDATGASDDLFGCSVSISGIYAIVGAYGDDAPGLTTDQGSASIFQYNGTNWILMQRITDATGMSYDYFGRSVSISGNYAIVAAENDDVGNNENQGSASIFQYNGTNWVMIKKITDGNGAAYDYFGISVSISGNYVIVGASWDDVGNIQNQGSASIYQRVGMAWQRLQYVTDPGGEKDDYFGNSTSIDGTNKRFLIGMANFSGGLGKAVFGKMN